MTATTPMTAHSSRFTLVNESQLHPMTRRAIRSADHVRGQVRADPACSPSRRAQQREIEHSPAPTSVPVRHARLHQSHYGTIPPQARLDAHRPKPTAIPHDNRKAETYPQTNSPVAPTPGITGRRKSADHTGRGTFRSRVTVKLQDGGVPYADYRTNGAHQRAQPPCSARLLRATRHSPATVRSTRRSSCALDGPCNHSHVTIRRAVFARSIQRDCHSNHEC